MLQPGPGGARAGSALNSRLGRAAPALIALAIVAVAAGFAIFGGGDEDVGPIAGGSTAEVSPTPGRSGTFTTATPSVTGGVPGGNVPSVTTAPGVVPGLGPRAATPCTAKRSSEVGVSDREIAIGQVLTDSPAIPQQFKPTYEGLAAYVKLFNARGGLCGRKLTLDYRNDGFNAAIHTQDMREMADEILAFVGNESLFDQLDYEGSPPFEPNFEGGGSKVPDVGGLAFSYPRGHSQWHAGVVGSVSPTLVGAAQYRQLQKETTAKGKPCTKGAVFYLQEPTGASEDQARVGQVSLEEDWGMNLGAGNTKLYGVSLLNTDVAAYEAIVDQMASDGMDCLFGYADVNSSIKLAQATRNRGYWPPSKCNRGADCFRVFYVPLAAYDQKFIRDGGDGALDVSTFIPHVPLNEPSIGAMKTYLDALNGIPGAKPSTFSVLGFASGAMFIEGLQGCREAPTRTCLMNALRSMKNFTAGGLLGGTTPFRTTKVTYGNYGTFAWKWIFHTSVALRVQDRNGKRDFYRTHPTKGFNVDVIHVARGTAA